jgi:hypothetical protein
LYLFVFAALSEIVSSFVFFRALLWLKKILSYSSRHSRRRLAILKKFIFSHESARKNTKETRLEIFPFLFHTEPRSHGGNTERFFFVSLCFCGFV